MGAMRQEVNGIFNANIETQNIRMTRYPAAAVGVTTTTGKSYAYGAYLGAGAEIIAAAAITTDYWLMSIGIDTASNADIYVVKIATGAVGSEVDIAVFHTDLTAVTANIPPMVLPIPVKVIANGRLTVASAAGSANNRTMNISAIVGTNVGS